MPPDNDKTAWSTQRFRAWGSPKWSVPLVIALAALPAFYIAATSNSYGADSFTTNTSDALVFRSEAELLWMGQSPYDADLQQRYISRTRLGGGTPPYTLPFAYPPNALPLLTVYLTGHSQSPRTPGPKLRNLSNLAFQDLV